MSIKELDQTSLGTTILYTIGATFAGLLIVGLSALPSLIVLSDISGYALLIGIIAISAFAVGETQNLIEDHHSKSNDSGNTGATLFIVGALSSFVYYNLMVLFAYLLSAVALNTISAPLGVAAATIYPFWDLWTRDRAIPLSAGGIVVAVLATAIVLHRVVLLTLQTIRKTTWQETSTILFQMSTIIVSTVSDLPKFMMEIYDTLPSAQAIIGMPEERSIRVALRKMPK